MSSICCWAIIAVINLPVAALQGQAGAVLWLCRHGANVTAVKDDGWKNPALHYAAARGHTRCVDILLAFGADMTARNFSGAHWAHVCHQYAWFLMAGSRLVVAYQFWVWQCQGHISSHFLCSVASSVVCHMSAYGDHSHCLLQPSIV